MRRGRKKRSDKLAVALVPEPCGSCTLGKGGSLKTRTGGGNKENSPGTGKGRERGEALWGVTRSAQKGVAIGV